MVSRADVKRRKRARSAARTQASRVAPSSGAPASPAPRGASRRPDRNFSGRDDGLDFLLGRQRISRAQADTGRTYGMLYRAAKIDGAAALRSCLDFSPRGGGGVGLPPLDLGAAEWVADCRRRLDDAQAVLGFHSGMIAALDLVCGRGFRPREITTVQRETEEIETSLRLALDLLGRHFRRFDASDSSGQ